MKDAIGAQEWYQGFRRTVRDNRWAYPLREAVLSGHLGAWTEHLTDVVVTTCSTLGWTAVALGHLSDVMPVPKQEYLAIDVMAFTTADRPCWRRPVAAFELENRLELEVVSYSLWKVSVLRCRLAGVFCYRRRPEEIGDLIAELTQGVMADLHQEDREGRELLLVVGTRSKAEDFPDGFFKPYVWEPFARGFRALW